MGHASKDITDKVYTHKERSSKKQLTLPDFWVTCVLPVYYFSIRVEIRGFSQVFKDKNPPNHKGLRDLSIPDNYRLENWEAFRAFFKPYLRRSFIRGSRVRKPARFRAGRKLASALIKARAIPNLTAPACPVVPPP